MAVLEASMELTSQPFLGEHLKGISKMIDEHVPVESCYAFWKLDAVRHLEKQIYDIHSKRIRKLP